MGSIAEYRRQKRVMNVTIEQQKLSILKSGQKKWGGKMSRDLGNCGKILEGNHVIRRRERLW